MIEPSDLNTTNQAQKGFKTEYKTDYVIIYIGSEMATERGGEIAITAPV